MRRRGQRKAIRRIGAALAAALPVAVAAFRFGASGPGDEWTPAERSAIHSLSLATAGPPPIDPSNRYADDPRVAQLGKTLFFDTKLSRRGDLSCAGCHQPGRSWQDGTPLGQGVGTTGRRTQPIAGTQYSPWLFWDGRADSQWAQALGPLESPVEHGGTRTLYARVIAANYRAKYEALFGAAPSLAHLPQAAGPNGSEAERVAWLAMSDPLRDSVTRVFVNIGKSIAAFERTLQFAPSRFDRFAARLAAGDSARPATAADSLTPAEAAGLHLFLGKGRCIQCHSGAMFTDNAFHNIGVATEVDGKPDLGRRSGVELFLADEFNCLGPWSDAPASSCSGAGTTVRSGDSSAVEAFRTPSLRNVTRRAPYGHVGRFATLEAIIAHHNQAPAARSGRNELSPLGLTSAEIRLIAGFLQTLDSREVFVPSSRTPVAADAR